MKRDIILPALSLFLICVIITGLLAFVKVVTADVITEREEADAAITRAEVLEGASYFVDITGQIDQQIQAGFFNKETKIFLGYDSQGGAYIGVLAEVTAKGYKGSLHLTVGFDPDGKVIKIKTGDHSETPGVGTKALDESFLDKFLIKPDAIFTAVKQKSAKNTEIDTISGATISSKAVIKGMNEAVQIFDMVKDIYKEVK